MGFESWLEYFGKKFALEIPNIPRTTGVNNI